MSMASGMVYDEKHVLEVRGRVLEDRKATLARVAPVILCAVRCVLNPTHPDLEDVVQESLIALVHALPSFRGDSTIAHFARQIAYRRAIDALRTTMRERRRREDLDAVDEHVPAPSLLERKKQKWRELLVELPDAQAEALVMRAIEGYSIEEIADIARVPHETIRSRVRLAKAALRERISRDPSFADLTMEVDA
jgi:RNA polymerase sigma-70 factor (ECF subfamily)